jgi:hypothetical protein
MGLVRTDPDSVAAFVLVLAGVDIQSAAFFGLHCAPAVGAAVQALVVQQLPLPVGHADFGAEQPVAAQILRRPATDGIGILPAFFYLRQIRQVRVSVVYAGVHAGAASK